MVDARPADSADAALAEAEIGAVLFGSPSTTAIGRFRLLGRLGAGGMGVVYAAYDPRLDRAVALKLVDIAAVDRERALVEAKALARLSHPNVVPVFDVGVEGSRVYIVMELVRGETLRQWVQRRSRREILDAYQQAGQALAAAHAADLAHRDFKPDNAIVGRDGRVRVVDFGLAGQLSASEPSAPRAPRGGTPRYMPPEQLKGGAVTAGADQYSFCVALAEAIEAHAAHTGELVPAWLLEILARGRSAEPGHRFGSMLELLRALNRDPVRRWRRRIAIAALAGIAAGAFMAMRAVLVAWSPACDGAERLAVTWSAADQAAGLAQVAKLGAYGASLAPSLRARLQEHQRRWVASYDDACESRRRGEQSDQLVDRRMACLERGRTGLAALAGMVGSSRSLQSLTELARATLGLSDPDECRDLAALLADVEPPPPGLAERVRRIRVEVDKARVAIAAGRFEPARAIALAAVTDARSVAYAPALAEALLTVGHAGSMMDNRAAAAPALAEATQVAFAAGAFAIGVEAWARRAWVEGLTGAGPRALVGRELIEAVAQHKASSRFARAVLYNQLAGVEIALDRRDQAPAALARALREADGLSGPGALERLSIRLNLGIATDDPVRKGQFLAEAVRERAALFGDEHPLTIQARYVRGTLTVPLAGAAADLAPACEGFDRDEGQRERSASCWAELGFVHFELGASKAAAEAMERGRRTGASAVRATPEVAPYAALFGGDPGGAIKAFRAAIAARGDAGPTEPWWERLTRAKLALGLGRAYVAAGAPAAALPWLRSSATTLSEIVARHPSPAQQRRLGRANAELAKTLHATARRGRELRDAAAAAAAWLRRVGGVAEEIDWLDQLARGDAHGRRGTIGLRGGLAENRWP